MSAQTILDKFLFFIINVLIARYLDKELFGEYATSLAYATFFSTFVDIGINSTLVRSISRDPENEDSHITNAFMLMTILAVISYGAMSVSLIFMNYNAEVVALVLVFGVVRIGNEYMRLFYAIYSAKERFIVQAINNTIFSILFLFATYAVIMYKGKSIAFAYSRLAIVLFFIVLLAFYTLSKVRFSINKKAIKSFIPQACYFGLSTIYANMYQRINIIILSKMHGTLFSGLFQNSYIIFSSVFFIPGNISRVLVSFLYKHNYEDNKEKYQFAYDIYSKVLSIISIYIAMVLFVYSDYIIVKIYGESFREAGIILKVTALAIPSLFNVSGILLTAIDRQKERTRCQLYTLIVNIIANFALIPTLKGVGAAWATVVTFFVMNQSYNVYLQKFTSISMKKSFITFIILCTIAALSGFSGVLLQSYFNPAVSCVFSSLIYGLLVPVFLIREKDITIIKGMFKK